MAASCLLFVVGGTVINSSNLYWVEDVKAGGTVNNDVDVVVDAWTTAHQLCNKQR